MLTWQRADSELRSISIQLAIRHAHRALPIGGWTGLPESPASWPEMRARISGVLAAGYAGTEIGKRLSEFASSLVERAPEVPAASDVEPSPVVVSEWVEDPGFEQVSTPERDPGPAPEPELELPETALDVQPVDFGKSRKRR